MKGLKITIIKDKENAMAGLIQSLIDVNNGKPLATINVMTWALKVLFITRTRKEQRATGIS